VQFGATTKTGIEVRGKGTGQSLYLDGKLLGDLPKRVTGLSVGEHTLLVTGGEGYYAEERKINLKADELMVINDLQLKPRMGELHIPASDQLAGATVLLDGVPIRIPYDKDLDASRRYHVEARRAGFEDFEAWVDFSGSDRNQTLSIQMLSKQGGGDTANRDSFNSDRSSSDRSSSDRSSSDRSNSEAVDRPVAASSLPAAEGRRSGRGRAAAGAAPEASDQARLNLISDPPAMVLLDGKPIGQTPRMGLSVSPGTHAVLFIHPTLGRARASAKLDAGQSKTLRARF
jgi:PEGA domain